jgi:hypothetical protein
MAFKREAVPTRKEEKKNDSLHSLNFSKTGGQNPQTKKCDLKEKILQF